MMPACFLNKIQCEHKGSSRYQQSRWWWYRGSRGFSGGTVHIGILRLRWSFWRSCCSRGNNCTGSSRRRKSRSSVGRSCNITFLVRGNTSTLTNRNYLVSFLFLEDELVSIYNWIGFVYRTWSPGKFLMAASTVTAWISCSKERPPELAVAASPIHSVKLPSIHSDLNPG